MTIQVLAPAAAAAEANPVDVMVQSGVLWYPVVPKNRDQLIVSIGALSYRGQTPHTPVEKVDESRKLSRVCGYIISGDRFGLDFPVIVIQDKKFVRNVERGEIKSDLMETIREIKERMEVNVKREIMAGSGIEEGLATQMAGTPTVTPTPGETPEITPITKPVERQPGFEAVLAMSGVLLYLYLFRRKR